MRKLFLVVLLVFFTLFPIFGQNKKLVAAANRWPPFTNPDNPEGGCSVEIVRAAFATQGYEIEMVYIPWARAEQGIKDSLYDISVGMWHTDERQVYFKFSDPYLVNEVKFIKRMDNPFEYDGVESLSGMNIGVMLDYGYDDEFLKATNFNRFTGSNFISHIQRLVQGNLDLTLEDEIVARMMIKNDKPELLEKIEFVGNPLSRNYLYVTSSLNNPGHEEFVNAFNRGFDIIKENGVYAKILDSYGIVKPFDR